MSLTRSLTRGLTRRLTRGLTSNAGVGVPAGFTRTTYGGVALTYRGQPVFDDGKRLYVRAA